MLVLVWSRHDFDVLCFPACSIELGEEALVQAAASRFQEICYQNRDSLMAGIICAGWDKKNGGQVSYEPSLFVSVDRLLCMSVVCVAV